MYDPVRNIAIQGDGRVIYPTAFGTITTIEPGSNKSENLQEARRQIQRADTKAHGWKR